MFTRLLLLPVSIVLLTACASLPEHPTTPQARNDGELAATAGADTTLPTNQATLLAAAEPVTGILVASLADAPAPDFWEQLRRDFGLPDQDNDRVRVHRTWYVKHPEYIKRVSERARRYAWHIQQELHKRDMPSEIALLPIVESAYDPFAYSHGRAAGLWQFIPSTGKRYGLKQDWWYDGRRDVVDSTRAALDYLQHLHERFKGDWLLALAAYNSGEGTVIKAQRRNRKQGKGTGFWELDLPRETRAYVPKLIALKQLVSTPGKYGVKLTPIANRPHFEIVNTSAQIDLAIAADLADMELDSLYRLNPGFNQWATPPKGPHRLLVPSESAEAFRQSIAQLPPEKRVTWIRHKVSSHETLSHIAKRYHTTVTALQTANNLNTTSIRVGKYLMVPVSSQDQGSYRLSAAQRLDRKKNSARNGYKAEHVVSNGDTLWDLSRKYKVGVRKLASWNGMAPGDPLRVGQTLVIWTNQPTSSTVHPGSLVRPVHYTVRKGDSLSRISSRFKVTVTDLRKWNSLPKGQYLQPGDRLKLYVDVTRQAADI